MESRMDGHSSRRPERRSTPAYFVPLVLALAVGCGGETGFSGPPVDDGDGNDLRPGLTVTVTVEPEASDLAQALGWTGGVPNAEVRLHRWGTDFEWQTATTDAEGVARFPNAIPGTYRLAAHRPLTDSEVAQGGGAVHAFGDGMMTNVSNAVERTLKLGPTREGSVVFSEVYATAPFSGYDFHMYFELHNNSQETVYLDGMIFGTMLGVPNVEGGLAPTCAESDPLRNDPDGVWAHFLHQFPGSGAEHPLLPGEVAVVAVDAIDHSVVDPHFPDLSGADFELEGTGDVDNPAVPNLPEVGVEPWFLGHGLRFFISDIFFLAEDLDPSSLERRVLRLNSDQTYLRIPADALLDVMATEEDDALNDQRFSHCFPIVHRSFDRLGGGFVKNGEDLGFSVQRLVIGTVNGRKILQDTNTSAVDLVRAPLTPGTTP
jgi:hypothetical protein